MNAYFFVLPSTEPGRIHYQHNALALAEGFASLGIACYGNIDYWPLDVARTAFAIAHDPLVSPGDCDLVVVSEEWAYAGAVLPAAIFERRRAYRTVCFDRRFGTSLRTHEPAFRHFDLILRSHGTDHTAEPANFRSWTFGLTNRIVEATRTSAAWSDRTRQLLVNFRHTRYPHSVRLRFERHVVPALRRHLPVDATVEASDREPADAYTRLLWSETGFRHHPDYYRRLTSSVASAAIGGWFMARRPNDKSSLLSRGLRRFISRSGIATSLVTQWDSWRLWESLAAGTATFHVDFERYGCRFPERPENWVHYVGIDFSQVDRDIERLAQPGLLERIAVAGRAWALRRYAPEPVARRLLAMLEMSVAERDSAT